MNIKQEAIPKLLAAINGFRWLGKNLDNIAANPAQFRSYYEAALEDAWLALLDAYGLPAHTTEAQLRDVRAGVLIYRDGVWEVPRA